VSHRPIAAVLRYARALAGAPAVDATDRLLLAAIAGGRDDAAFAALLDRYGPLVWSVARRLLGHGPDAEDAFQATFLVLARQGGSIRRPDRLSAWLVGVTRRVALKARRAAPPSDRQSSDRRPDDVPDLSGDPADALADAELRRLVIEELAELPVKYQQPLILCYLQGRTHRQAAADLGWPSGSLSRRIEKACALLRERLTRRGVTATVAGVTAALAGDATATPPLLVAQTLQLVGLVVAGEVTAASASVLRLADGVTVALTAAKLKAGLAAVVALVAIGTGICLVAQQGRLPSAPPALSAAPPQVASAPARLDQLGDPLPPGAMARLGTTRFRPGSHITHLAFSPDGRRLASWSGHVLSICDAASGRELSRTELPNAKPWAMAWLANGRGITVLDLGFQSFYVWNFADENAERPPAAGPNSAVATGNGERVSQFVIAPDGRWLALGRMGLGPVTRNWSIDLIELQTGQWVADLPRAKAFDANPGNCVGLAFTTDGRSLVALSGNRNAADHHLALYELSTGQVRKEMTVPAALQQGTRLTFAVSPNGRTVALGLNDGSVRLVSLVDGTELRSFGRHSSDRRNSTGVSAVTFSPDGRFLLTAGRDDWVRVWDPDSGREIRPAVRAPGWPEALALAPDGKRVAAGGQGGLIHVWDPATGIEVDAGPGHRAMVAGVRVTRDGRTAITWDWDRLLRFWDLATGREQRQIDWSKADSFWPVLTPDGRSLLLSDGNGFSLLNLATGQQSPSPGGLANARGMPREFDADGQVLITTHKEVITFWDWPGGRQRRMIRLSADDAQFVTQPGEVFCSSVSLSPDGRTLAVARDWTWTVQLRDNFTGGSSETLAVELWDVPTGERLRRLGFKARNVRFLPDGQSLLTTGRGVGPSDTKDPAAVTDGSVLWNTVTGEKRRSFAYPEIAQPGSKRFIVAFALSPDGRLLATAEDDHTVLLYEVATGQARHQLAGHRDTVLALAFTPDSRRLLTASRDHTVLVWDMTGPALPLPPPNPERWKPEAKK
jgi:RNA polymerase sigma factor (sigma-70 family)